MPESSALSDSARTSLTARIKARALELGFSAVGVTPADPPPHWAFYVDWLERGCAGEMGYLALGLGRRGDPRNVVPGAKSVLCVAMDYGPGRDPDSDGAGPLGAVSCYARGEDYHDLMGDRLSRLLSEIRELDPSAEGRAYVDTGPVLERDFAARAGIGWFGKHTNLIRKRGGSWFFLGTLILTVDLDFDSPAADHCGTCDRCIRACPTGAIVEPYVLDARRCISYLSVELRGAIPRDLRPGMGDWIFGCDVCQDVCPWNAKHARPSREPGFRARPGLEAPDLPELLGMDQVAFSERFRGSPVKRAKRRGLLRNAAVALGNSGEQAHVPVLAQALEDSEPLVRGHAAWALGRVGGERARHALVCASAVEADADVRGEIDAALAALDEEGGTVETDTHG
jgi:epoxyqueuosine reductase